MEKLVSLYAYAADLGSCVSQFKLAQCYEAGLHVTKDMQTATDLYLKSAEQNYSPAIAKCINLYLAREIAGDKLERIVANAMPRKLLCHAFEFFNILLFDGVLKPLYVSTDYTPQGKNKWSGIFLTSEIKIRINSSLASNIAMLETLVHEMTHYWSFRYKKKKARGVHDKVWKEKMRELGLRPVGKFRKWWQQVVPSGHFARARVLFLAWMDSVVATSSHSDLSDICCPDTMTDIGVQRGLSPCRDCILATISHKPQHAEVYRDAFVAHCKHFLEKNLFYAQRGTL